ncbi:essential MCU regulator, mitochondrial [Stomoxys calcitrans]|uniref:Essential MCU regulator, mitochondrial n=1 Tax=Stomoxys calcitrans TaxID=35570 RepID=A0A1I8P036_STOCA|nr:essential MCU regulator, mitochondrial [Stomoxys calcitrans]
MLITRIAQIKAVATSISSSPTIRQLLGRTISEVQRRQATHFRSGALKPKPEETPFGMVGVLCSVLPGLFIGAAISKSVANFLEENDLFVPEDDDDDED